MAVTRDNGHRDAIEPMPEDAEKFMGKICQITSKWVHQLLCTHLTPMETTD